MSDDQEHFEGYMDGYDLSAPEPSDNRSWCYRHSFAVARRERFKEEPIPAHQGQHGMTNIAIPEGMKAWHGGDKAPDDWDGGQVFGNDGRVYGPDGVMWERGLYVRGIGIDIIAYTPKPQSMPVAG